MSTWRSYDAATSEDAFLDPLYICVECGTRKDEALKACSRCGNKEAERFVFPKAVPMDFGLEFYRLASENDNQIPTVELVPLFPQLFGPKRYERLQALGKKTGQTQALISGVFDDLLREYGFTSEPEEEEDPLGKGKAGKPSRKRSSTTSGRSKPTSKPSTSQTTSTENARAEAGAGSSTASKP